MGTPEFAVPCLRELLNTEEVLAVFTKPDKRGGRGNKMLPSAVKIFAESHNIPVYQPLSLKTGDDAESAYETLLKLSPDLIIVAAYGQILPERILNLPKIFPRCINLHGSLLPKLRGAAPIERAVMGGDRETGITSMVMAKGLDTGDMLLARKTEINENETAVNLRLRLSEIAAKTLLDTLAVLKAGKLIATPQNNAEATYAKVIEKNESKVDFTDTAANIHNIIRAVSGFGMLHGKRIKIFSTRKTDIPVGDNTPGKLISDNGLYINCSDYLLQITELQPEGGKRLSAEEYLRGHKIDSDSVLS
ncbi:MAG: methionyl-tRNA formyltransferase [Ruminococcus sp.]|jgi:methionyl-tRNA formyltransferase|nr:methionyl-tRNA formyltransferase [Ruminococcus sp.]